ncbi:hypothetical protein ACFU6I_41435 [Streptomyces sp. NPDC057486]|uniref:hypothetical protein n=1 Tax=Streptomyces sp. NPDC057486 TaxID=3346145 RepID=UPI0036810244
MLDVSDLLMSADYVLTVCKDLKDLCRQSSSPAGPDELWTAGEDRSARYSRWEDGHE